MLVIPVANCILFNKEINRKNVLLKFNYTEGLMPLIKINLITFNPFPPNNKFAQNYAEYS